MKLSEIISNFKKALLRPMNYASLSVIGVYCIAWGLWVACPFWDVFSRAPIYKILAGLPPEWMWGLLIVAVGIIVLIAAYESSCRWLMISSAVGGWFWFMIAIFYFIGDWQSGGGLTALMLSLYMGHIYLNVRVNSHHTDKNFADIIKSH